MNEPKIGILGLGSRSTQFYINELNTQYNKIHKGYSTFPFILYNTNFDEVNPYLPNNFEKLEVVLSNHLENISQLDIPYWIIPNITLHETFDRLSSNIKIIHPVHLTIELLKKKGRNKAIVFGSRYTMESDYLKKNFSNGEIKLIEPTEDEKGFIDSFRKKIYTEKELVTDIESFSNLIQKYSASYVVVIACTELSLFSNLHNEMVIDMASVQINESLKLVN